MNHVTPPPTNTNSAAPSHTSTSSMPASSIEDQLKDLALLINEVRERQLKDDHRQVDDDVAMLEEDELIPRESSQPKKKPSRQHVNPFRLVDILHPDRPETHTSSTQDVDDDSELNAADDANRLKLQGQVSQLLKVTSTTFHHTYSTKGNDLSWSTWIQLQMSHSQTKFSPAMQYELKFLGDLLDLNQHNVMYNMYQFAISELVVRRTLQLFEVHNGGGTREAWAKVEYLMPKNYSQRVVSGAIDPAVLKENKHQLELASSLPSYTPFRRATAQKQTKRTPTKVPRAPSKTAPKQGSAPSSKKSSTSSSTVATAAKQ